MRIFLILLLFFACSDKSQDHTDEGHTNSNSASQANGALTWQAPEGWVAEEPSSSMRKAQFSLPADSGDPEDGSVVVFYFSGQGGGVQENIERWTAQFKQPESGEPEVTKGTANGLPYTILDLSGTYLFKTRPMAPTATEKPHFRMLAAVIEASSGPWFVKFVGPAFTVEKWQPSFMEFIDSFKEGT